ncbi:phage-related baseplate assembly protein [Lachnotalea glycerini]|uniref:Phage-related baseplate assembly protein n=1 Tax=Lachnotalea glycerini TaxID=1763509 RepID=A0A318EPQ2_9FIRM|nr:baseplate J/gp47 family protein [Lachnotalea glycerini]PXV87370.1 phage-related baseplate assembly protein [Lachnotalea glycerini]
MSTIKKTLQNYPDISFIENKTLETVVNEMINDFTAKYEEETGRTISLTEANPDRLILYAAALQIYQVYQYIDHAGKQSLLKYSYGDFLENIGALKQINRNEGNAATVQLMFELSGEQPSIITIPMGTRATAGDGIYFYTKETAQIKAGKVKVTVTAVCDKIGSKYNGYVAGSINTLVTPIAFVSKVSNVDISTGGSDREEDDSLAENIYLAPSSYSVAGPGDAYKYWVKHYNSSITDVYVDTPEPCKVDIRFILNDGELPNETLANEVLAYISDGTKRPQTDYVSVGAPTLADYDIDLIYYINTSDANKAATIQSEVNIAIQSYISWQKAVIGRDINPSYLISKIVDAGAKRVEIISPVFEAIPNTALANHVSKNIIYGGLEDD